ncbi:hypothetical protein [Pseudomonas citronellolis]|uniref:hypothetical protein n=1 Tax=Pseudomonas citronellolis TaxID=53408 RepID=UPI000778CCC0|nr:hypothetical protein [Pseudomonas citronellolis]AMO78018.1 hypothetical protein PcP3B5_46260 [Pseudomonas citronellolis]
MSECAKPLLVITTDRPLSMEAREKMARVLEPIAQSIGAKPLILDDGLQAGIHSDIRPLLESLLDEQRKTNGLLLALVEAMADERDPDAEPQTYLNGKTIR